MAALGDMVDFFEVEELLFDSSDGVKLGESTFNRFLFIALDGCSCELLSYPLMQGYRVTFLIDMSH